jgi:hypothetical protein
VAKGTSVSAPDLDDATAEIGDELGPPEVVSNPAGDVRPDTGEDRVV